MTFAFVIPQLLSFRKLQWSYSRNKFLCQGKKRGGGGGGWPLMERYRASSNYSLCSQAFATLHSLLVSCSFFIHFRELTRSPFLPPVSWSGFVFFFSSSFVLFPFPPYSSPFLLSTICFSPFAIFSYGLLFLFIPVPFFFSFEIYRLPLPRPPFRMIFAAIGSTLLSQRMAISVNFG